MAAAGKEAVTAVVAAMSTEAMAVVAAANLAEAATANVIYKVSSLARLQRHREPGSFLSMLNSSKVDLLVRGRPPGRLVAL